MEDEENKQEIVENGITTHSLESDLRDLGIVEESPTEETAEDVPEPKEESKKLSRKERRVQKLANTNKELREKVAELESKQVVQPAKEEVSEINIDDFENYDDYLKAVNEQEGTKKEEVVKPKESETVTILDTELQQEMLEDGIEDYKDFEELVMADDLALTENVLELVLDTENSSDVAYYLATHKEETLKIANMTPEKMARAILKIEVVLESSPKKKAVQTTNAPKPITPVGGKSAKATSLNDENLSFEQHEALLNAQPLAHSGGFI